MPTKLAGQRAKFSRARSQYFTALDEAEQHRAAEKMAEVLADASANGFSEPDVTQGEDVPAQARDLVRHVEPGEEETDEEAIQAAEAAVDRSGCKTIGTGPECVYAYGYACAQDRLKVGSSTGDVISRVASQIHTSTPDRPHLVLMIQTHDARALERSIHGILRLHGRKVPGAGAEWFFVSPRELEAIYERIADALS
ncbi:T5orf172 domain-containing protein [Limimonas halophila]|uniref:T5orf172 domain-containing protein n=1 Tax=Limimonas halophila TaxID=1082479 RepID=A0A1G7T5L8_9PROT|nr:GIY-YIG nuclease family protein [Limimonas halophila]SDG29919.1 T5orf172 domain-containing protein [Limimonas halophila]